MPAAFQLELEGFSLRRFFGGMKCLSITVIIGQSGMSQITDGAPRSARLGGNTCRLTGGAASASAKAYTAMMESTQETKQVAEITKRTPGTTSNY